MITIPTLYCCGQNAHNACAVSLSAQGGNPLESSSSNIRNSSGNLSRKNDASSSGVKTSSGDTTRVSIQLPNSEAVKPATGAASPACSNPSGGLAGPGSLVLVGHKPLAPSPLGIVSGPDDEGRLQPDSELQYHMGISQLQQNQQQQWQQQQQAANQRGVLHSDANTQFASLPPDSSNLRPQDTHVSADQDGTATTPGSSGQQHLLDQQQQQYQQQRQHHHTIDVGPAAFDDGDDDVTQDVLLSNSSSEAQTWLIVEFCDGGTLADAVRDGMMRNTLGKVDVVSA